MATDIDSHMQWLSIAFGLFQQDLHNLALSSSIPGSEVPRPLS